MRKWSDSTQQPEGRGYSETSASRQKQPFGNFRAQALTAAIALPLLGLTMQWTGAYPIVLYGDIRLPALLPQSDAMHTLLWDAHFYLAFAFFAIILLHVAAALFHALVRRDGVFQSMAPTPSHDAPTAVTHAE
jgi:cytochrome b561